MILYKLISFIYCKITSLLEVIFIKIKNKTDDDLNIKGYQLFKFDENLISNIKFKEVLKINNYLEKLIISESNIDEIIRNIFVNKNFLHTLSNITGYNYSLDFLTAYRTYSIAELDKKKNLYANKWHVDKPFSSNCLKVIIPIKPILTNGGGINIINKNDSKKFYSNYSSQNINIFTMSANLNEILVFNPNQCFHKATSPAGNSTREQIIIQLNPSKKWTLNCKIFYKQYHREPKFPVFSYFFDKRKIIC